MRVLVVAALSLSVLPVGTLIHSSHAGSASCLGPSAQSDLAVGWTVSVFTRKDDALRAKFHLPLLRASDISLVTTDATCQAAVRGVDSADGSQTPAPRPIYLVRAGTDYYVVGEAGGGKDQLDIQMFWIVTSKFVAITPIIPGGA